MKKEMTISAIEDGTVIDHIPSNAVFSVVEILKLEKELNELSIATNLSSKHMKKKGIVKIAGKQLSQEEVNKIAIVAPEATVNIINDYDVKQKLHVMIPDTIKNIIKCSNPNCITNIETVQTLFYVTKKNPIVVTCHYCERMMHKEDIRIL